MAFTGAPIGMAIVDERGRITMANDALARITGCSVERLAERSMLDLIEPDDRDEDAADRPRLFAGKLSGYDTRLRLRGADGASVWVALTVSGDGEMPPLSLIYQVQDISERRALEGRLEHLIDHDFLTGLFNRRRFEQELDHEIARQRRSAPRAAVLMLDLDGFKAVNDRLGHAMGDELLRGLAADLHARTRETDVLARLSGDEFAMLMPDTDREEAETVAADVIALVRPSPSLARRRGCPRDRVRGCGAVRRPRRWPGPRPGRRRDVRRQGIRRRPAGRVTPRTTRPRRRAA